VITQRRVDTFIISLDKDVNRREVLGAQLDGLNIPYSIASAVHGASLSEQELAYVYDRDKAITLFNRELSRGEIGCALSHVGVYRKMVDENIPYALILEDDAKSLDSGLAAILDKLSLAYSADEPVVVLLSHVQRYDANKKTELDSAHYVYEAYRGVGAHGYFITKAAAKALADNLFPAYVVADKWEYFQEKFITVNALVPYVIGLAPASLISSIGSMGVREKRTKSGRRFLYYARRYIKRATFALTSRPFIRVEYQKKSDLDL
jgi:glycosyl transferase family 25